MMNTADRSIALLDTALRRRFDFKELAPDPGILQQVGGIDLPAVLRAIDGRLEWLIDRVMKTQIVPLIAEYFHDDWGKVQAVLGGGDDFVRREPLSTPPGIDSDGEERYRWTACEPPFPVEAYARLVSGSAERAAEEGEDRSAPDGPPCSTPSGSGRNGASAKTVRSGARRTGCKPRPKPPRRGLKFSSSSARAGA